jgi:hypothetical protein
MVHAQPSVKGAFDVEIKGRLQELLGTPFVKLSVGGGPLVAGVRYIANPTIAEALFSYRRAAQLGSHDFIHRHPFRRMVSVVVEATDKLQVVRLVP